MLKHKTFLPILSAALAVSAQIGAGTSAWAVAVDASESPTGCTPPAGNLYTRDDCPLRFRCNRTDKISGTVTPGSQTPVGNWSDDANNCAGDGMITHHTTVSDTVTWEAEFVAGASIVVPIPQALTVKLETKVKRGTVSSFTKVEDTTVPPHRHIRYDWTLTQEDGRTGTINSTYECGVRASRWVYADPFALTCRIDDYDNGWISYSGGGPVASTTTLDQALIPGTHENSVNFPCPE